jgi:hypothetical protein
MSTRGYKTGMARYHIMVREYGGKFETVLAQCDSSPMALVEGARNKRLRERSEGRTFFVAKYEHVYALDTQTGEVIK